MIPDMPSIFQFQQGTESRVRPTSDSSPLLGRFRAVPPPRGPRRQTSQLGLFSNGRGSVHVGYGALVVGDDDVGHSEDDSDDGLEDGSGLSRLDWLWQRWVIDLWVNPRQLAVKRVAERWYTRYGLLVVLPAAMTICWCSIPFPQYPLPEGERDDVWTHEEDKTPGHGRARVLVNFWFFIFVYYGFYNVTALFWITKVFNLYGLNW